MPTPIKKKPKIKFDETSAKPGCDLVWPGKSLQTMLNWCRRRNLTKTNSHLCPFPPAGVLWILGPCSREELYHSKACTFFAVAGGNLDGMMKATTLQVHTNPIYSYIYILQCVELPYTACLRSPTSRFGAMAAFTNNTPSVLWYDVNVLKYLFLATICFPTANHFISQSLPQRMQLYIDFNAVLGTLYWIGIKFMKPLVVKLVYKAWSCLPEQCANMIKHDHLSSWKVACSQVISLHYPASYNSWSWHIRRGCIKGANFL